MRRALLLGVLLAGTAGAAPVRVVTTFSILADLVQNVGGDRVSLANLVPPGGDTHTYEPSTGDIRTVADAQVVFENGAGLESWFVKLRPSAQNARLVLLSDGLKKQSFVEDGQTVTDPHLWWNPENVVAYVGKIRDTLTQLDPAGRALYASNAARYVAQVRAADAAAKQVIATLPTANRKLVTNHDALGYFARHYGFMVVGEVIPSLGTEQEPSAQDTVKLIQAIRAQRVRAIFTENVINNKLAQTISAETGVKVAPTLFTDALGPKGSAGDTYLKALKYNVATIVKALK